MTLLLQSDSDTVNKIWNFLLKLGLHKKQALMKLEMLVRILAVQPCTPLQLLCIPRVTFLDLLLR